jgi:hypothetical protein
VVQETCTQKPFLFQGSYVARFRILPGLKQPGTGKSKENTSLVVQKYIVAQRSGVIKVVRCRECSAKPNIPYTPLRRVAMGLLRFALPTGYPFNDIHLFCVLLSHDKKRTLPVRCRVPQLCSVERDGTRFPQIPTGDPH